MQPRCTHNAAYCNVEEFLLRLHCSPLYINMAFGFESMGGNGVFKKISLNISKRRLIVTKFSTSIGRRRQGATFPSTDFRYLSPKIFGAPLNFSLPLRPMGPKISNSHKKSGSTDLAEILSTCGRH